MNKQYVAWNLEEAEEALRGLLAELKDDPEYEDGSFSVDLAHIYHHLNTAWNARNVNEERANKCSDADFSEWSKFPVELSALTGHDDS